MAEISSRTHCREKMQGPTKHNAMMCRYILLVFLLWLIGIGCVPPTPECEKDTQCKSNQRCEAGSCVEKMPTTSECPSRDGGICTSCSTDAECSSTQKCLSGTCMETLECTSDKDCTGKASPFCSPDGRCVLECKEDLHCTNKTKPFCSSARLCEWECKQDADCKDDKACKSNRCVLRAPECRADADCKGRTREYCSDAGQCEWQCKSNAHCNAWDETCEQHVCQPNPGSCKIDADCQQGKQCLRSRCVQPCMDVKESRDCNQGEVCVQMGLFCGKVCDRTSQCPGGFVCEHPEDICNGKRCTEEGRCIPWRPEAGTGQRGETCDRGAQTSCDGTKDLYCSTEFSAQTGSCALTCRPGQDVGCDSGEVCEIASCSIENTLGPQGCPHLGGTCIRKGSKKAGESCSLHPNGKERCAPGLQCDESKCYKPCDPAKEQTNPVCDRDSRCLPYWRSLPGGLCFPKGVQREGQLCDETTKYPFQALQYCVEGLFCHNYICVKPCDGAKGQETNPDCATDQQCLALKASHTGSICVENGAKEGEQCSPQQPCIKGLVCEQYTRASICARSCKGNADCRPNQTCLEAADNASYCRNRCDPARGFALNPDCEGRTYCEAAPNAQNRNHCLPLRALIAGNMTQATTQLYEVCGFTAFPLVTQGCQFNLGQDCIDFDGNLHLRCFQTCDPKKGVLSNATCNGAACREFLTPEGGVCEPLGTAKEGEVCSLQAGCEKGLVCYGFKCVKACDPRQPNACGAGAFCWRQRCVNKCNVSEGIYPNPVCSGYTHCFDPRRETTLGIIPNQAYCESNAAPVKGSQQKGEACSINTILRTPQCDNTAGLICDYVCRQMCDPKKGFFGNTDCQKGQVCLTNTPHTFIGPPRAAGGSCAFACQPENGVQADCPVGTICIRQTGDNRRSYGFCEPVATVERGPRELGETCLTMQSQACNGNKELFCQFSTVTNSDGSTAFCDASQTPTGCAADQTCVDLGGAKDECHTGTCLQSCEIGSNSKCKAGEFCALSLESPTGGTCAPQPSQKLGESCAALACIAGLQCNQQICRQTCDETKEKIGSLQCPGSQQCRSGVCIPLPPKQSGTKRKGESCNSSNICDGNNSLFCEYTTCLKACDRLTGTGCDSNEHCELTTRSYTGAGCFTKDTKKIGESCRRDADCFGESQLFCNLIVKKACQKTCDPKSLQGCQSNEVCAENDTSPTGGGCFPKVPAAQEREKCNKATGLVCAQGLLCACDPDGSSLCVCIKANAQEGHFCNGKQWRCGAGLVCWASRCLKQCDMTKGTSPNPTCKSNEACRKSATSTLGGMCFPG